MSPLDEFADMLSAKGVEFGRSTPKGGGHVTLTAGGLAVSASNAWPRNDASGTRLVLHVSFPTPEQAVGIVEALERIGGTGE